MLESFTDKDELTFKDITPEECEKRGILGRLYGPCASTIKATRNGRYYSDELWEKVFENPINRELLKQGGIPGELDHPLDRSDTDSSKIAIMMPEAPRKDKDGHLVGYWDIIDTPCGKIAYALAKYGFKLGISSRGSGETFTGKNGNEEVDPDSYEFSAFDLVLVPACADARLSLITEGLDNKQSALKKALSESLASATPEDRKIMETTLKDLNIDISNNDEYNHESVIDKDTDIAAKDIGAEVLKSLQEALLAKESAEATITKLQEKLSVCYAKEATLEEDLNKYKGAVRNLSENASSMKGLQSKLDDLTEKLQQKDQQLKEQQELYQSQLKKKALNENRVTKLEEAFDKREKELSSANQTIKTLNEKIEQLTSEHAEAKQKLDESYQELQKDYKLKNSEYNRKLSDMNKLVEKYRDTAQRAVDHYIKTKAMNLGLNPEDIKNKLPRNYSFNDIDKVCKDLTEYNLQINSLPFDLKAIKNASVVEASKLPNISLTRRDDGDDVDDDLVRLAINMSNNN